MSILTPFFNLFKLAKTNEYDIQQFNDNMDIIDTELHRPPLTVNNTEPNPTTRDIQITTIPLADNLTSDEAQINTGTYIDRTSGGEASIADGSAWLTSLQGNQVKTGYVAESIQMTVMLADPTAENPISASLDRDTFVEEVTSSQTITLTYSNAWDSDPATYGITVTGTPVAGDKIQVVYVKENRGTITVATPTSFVSTGWNLYNHAAGYAKVVKYSNEYGFMIEGTYTALKFSETLSGEQTDITPVDGYFTVPSDGYVFVTGGNSTDTAIWMTWSDWTEEANGGVFAAYSQTVIDLSGVMVDFPNGLMKIGNYYDEINLNTQMAYSRVQRLEYTDENLAGVIASGVPYDTDANYIYAVRVSPVSYSISLDGEYTASDHGMEMFIGTSVPVTASSLYGNDLKGKLRRDVLTISQQTLTDAQKTQVQANIGVDKIVEKINMYSWTATTVSALETELTTLGGTMASNEVRNIRGAIGATSSAPFSANTSYGGTIRKLTTGRYNVSLQSFSSANYTIEGDYNSGWTWNSINDQIAIHNVSDWHDFVPTTSGIPKRRYGYSSSSSVLNQPLSGNNTYFGWSEGWSTYYVVHLIVHYSNLSYEIGQEYNAYYQNGTWTPWIKVSGNDNRVVELSANGTYKFKILNAYGCARVYVWGYDNSSIGEFMIHNNNGTLTYKKVADPTSFSISMASDGTVTVTSSYQYAVRLEVVAVGTRITFGV